MTKVKRTYSLDEEVVARLEAAAKKNRRALSQQLSLYIEAGLEREGATDDRDKASRSTRKVQA